MRKVWRGDRPKDSELVIHQIIKKSEGKKENEKNPGEKKSLTVILS